MPITIIRQLANSQDGWAQWEVEQGGQILVMSASQLVWATR